MNISFSSVRELANAQGLELLSCLSREEADLQLREQVSYLERWQKAGYAAEMKFMQRPKELFASLQSILPESRSIVVFAIPYSDSPSEHGWDLRQGAYRASLPPGYGRVARYAWGDDYHSVIRIRLKQLVTAIEKALNVEIRHRIFADAVPLLERAVASSAGLGFIGKHSLLIRPRVGSYYFIGEILWDLDIQGGSSSSSSTPGSGCGSCQRCIDICPTGAIVDPGVVDARRCISYLTIEKRSVFSDAEVSAVGEWLFGCDVCQDVCPFNARENGERVPQEFCGKNGPWISLAEVLAIKDSDEYQRRFGSSALSRAGREGLIRNALAVALNTDAIEVLPSMLALEEDPSPIIRATLLQVLRRLKDRLEGLDLLRVERVLAKTDSSRL